MFFLGTCSIHSQSNTDTTIIQFSGLILDGSTEELFPIPYTNVAVVGTNRGVYSDFKGFFSIVVRVGDTIQYSSVGYKTAYFTIPDGLYDNRYSIVQLMTQDTINLPETVVFPWPDRDNFTNEFLALDVTSEMQERALENVAAESMARITDVPSDGDEHTDLYLREQAKKYYHIGQTPPMNIFNPISWKKFFDAWKEGKFKKKKKKK